MFGRIFSWLVLRIFRGFQKRANRLATDPAGLGQAVEKDFKKPKPVRGPLKRLRKDLTLMYGITRDWYKGEYKTVPVTSIIMIVGALLYFISPLDAIPDFIPFIGYIDDAFILGLTIGQIRADLDAYEFWKLSQSAKNPSNSTKDESLKT